jgi:hypothetical protein
MTGDQRDLERRAGQIIWEAAALTPGVPGHAGKTAVLVSRMCTLLREAQAAAQQLATAAAQASESAAQLAAVAAPETQPEPAAEPTISVEQRQALLAVYAKPERRH